MNVFLPVFLVLAAPFVGSFLGVLALRLPEHKEVVFARSKCAGCGRSLGVRDLIPVASYIAASGRCRMCRAPIPALYPAIELAALGVAVVAVLTTSGALLPITCLLGWALLVLFATDVRAFILPDVITLPLIPVGLAVSLLLPGAPLAAHIVGAILGAVMLWAVAAAYEAIRKRKGLGLGDVKLFAAAGAWLGWEPLPYVLLGATLAAVAIMGALRLLGRKITGTTMFPLGAPLALAFFAAWLVIVRDVPV